MCSRPHRSEEGFMNAGFSPSALTFDGRDEFLYAGDVHYFRMPRSQWADTLAKAKSAGCNAILTYVPWNWHELDDDLWDWDGTTLPERDLPGFLRQVAASGLRCVLRPGPFITAEWLHGGIPAWLLQAYPEIRTLDANGHQLPNEIDYPPITYLHPIYESYARRYLEAVMQVARPYMATEGGPIVGVQLDDEPSYWQLLRERPTLLDYNPVMVGSGSQPGFFQLWLSRMYRSIDELNRAYRTSYEAFDEVPAPRTDPTDLTSLRRHVDWYHCKLDAILEHVVHLSEWLLESGATVPQYVLFPYLLLQASGRFARLARDRGLSFVIGSECYLAVLGVAEMAEDFVGTIAGIHAAVRAWSKVIGSPPVSLETQAGGAFHLYPGAMEALTVMAVGHGLNGLSYYMLAGGDTPPDYAVQFASYDVGSPIGGHGEIGDLYPTVERFGRFFSSFGGGLTTMEPRSDIAVATYEPYEAISVIGGSLQSGLQDDYRDVFENYFGVYYHTRRGMTLYSLIALTGLTIASVDLEAASLDTLLEHPQLWVLGLDAMDRATQEKLVAYVHSGGHLVVMPRVPHLDEDFYPSSLLAELFPFRPIRAQTGTKLGRLTPHHVVRVPGVCELTVADYVDTFDIGGAVEPLAFEHTSGAPCAYRSVIGRGSATLVGFKLRYWWDARLDHKKFVDYLFAKNEGRRAAYAEGWELSVQSRSVGDGGFLFVSNPQPSARSARVSYIDPVNGQTRTIPSTLDGIDLPGGRRTNRPIRTSGRTRADRALDVPGPIHRCRARMRDPRDLGIPGNAGGNGRNPVRSPSGRSRDRRARFSRIGESPPRTVTYRHTGGNQTLKIELGGG